MKNKDVEAQIIDCLYELRTLKKLIAANKTQPLGGYLTQYAIVRAAGTIEQAFKTLIADHTGAGAKGEITTYLLNTVRDSSMLPNYSNICKLLDNFNSTWKLSYKVAINAHVPPGQINNSLDNLNKARNQVAHGKSTTMDFSELMESLRPSIKAMKYLDKILI